MRFVILICCLLGVYGSSVDRAQLALHTETVAMYGKFWDSWKLHAEEIGYMQKGKRLSIVEKSIFEFVNRSLLCRFVKLAEAGDLMKHSNGDIGVTRLFILVLWKYVGELSAVLTKMTDDVANAPQYTCTNIYKFLVKKLMPLIEGQVLQIVDSRQLIDRNFPTTDLLSFDLAANIATRDELETSEVLLNKTLFHFAS